jgi:hypothetical protein
MGQGQLGKPSETIAKCTMENPAIARQSVLLLSSDVKTGGNGLTVLTTVLIRQT